MSAFFRNIIYIYIFIYMLHFVKNEEKYFISYEDSKWEFTLNTKNEDSKLFYEKLKEKRIELVFYFRANAKSIFREYNDNFSLGIEFNDNNYGYPEPLNIFADYEELGIAGIAIEDADIRYKYSILGKIIGTPESLSDFSSLVSGLADEESITLVFEIKEVQKESNNIDLILLIMFIIIIILLIVCLLTFLLK